MVTHPGNGQLPDPELTQDLGLRPVNVALRASDGGLSFSLSCLEAWAWRHGSDQKAAPTADAARGAARAAATAAAGAAVWGHAPQPTKQNAVSLRHGAAQGSSSEAGAQQQGSKKQGLKRGFL